jgi:hypothetical protein
MKNVGSGMLLVGLGTSLANELGYAAENERADNDRLDYGDMTPLVRRMQSTPPAKLQSQLIDEIQNNTTELKSLIAAAALANAETFGGTDYVGYHAEMALLPALHIANELSGPAKSLPILKVIYRNTERIQKVGGAEHIALKKMKRDDTKVSDKIGVELRNAVRAADMDKAEKLFVQIGVQDKAAIEKSYNLLLNTIEDEVDVHRFVLAFRAYDLIDVVGSQHAHTMLRQCVRHCVGSESSRISKGRPASPIRSHLPKLMDQFKLQAAKPGSKDPGSKWVAEMADYLYDNNKFKASEAVAGAIAEGISIETIGEAISMAANQLVLRQGTDPWRTHGASAGVHCSDSVNAWRNMVRVADDQNKIAGTIVSAFYAGRYRPFAGQAYPLESHREKVKTTDAKELLDIAEQAIRSNDQPTATAAIAVYGGENHNPQPVFELMRQYAISEDGRLHSEKYYRTVVEEYKTTRPEFRWNQLVALARVTASAYGYTVDDQKGQRAPGYEDACKRLKVKA